MSKQGENTENKTNILSMDNIKKRHEEMFKMSEQYVFIGEETLSYKVYDVFPQSKKNEYIRDILEFVVKTVTEAEYEELVGDIATFTLISLIDKFTDIEVPEDDKEKILYMGYLADFNILNPIIESLDEEEMKKVLSEAQVAIQEHTKKMNAVVDEYSDKSGDIEDLSSLRLVDKDIKENE